jgi:hypothetical protein
MKRTTSLPRSITAPGTQPSLEATTASLLLLWKLKTALDQSPMTRVILSSPHGTSAWVIRPRSGSSSKLEPVST